VRLNVSNSVFLAAVFALALISVGLKAAAGPPDDGKGAPDSRVNEQLASALKAQGFSISLSPRAYQSWVIMGKRGDCRLSVRDAREGIQVATVFSREAGDIGPVRYLYRGTSSDSPPATSVWLDRFQNKVLNRLRVQRRIPVPVALATSPACSGQNFGLSDFRVE